MKFLFDPARTAPFRKCSTLALRAILFGAFGIVLLSACGEKRSRVVSSSSSLSTGGCEILPDSATVTDAPGTMGARACPTVAGGWTRYDLVIDSDGRAEALRTCNARDDDHPGSQEEFDSSTVAAAESGITAYSNHDFRVSTICASGSFLNDDGGTETRRVRIWERE